MRARQLCNFVYSVLAESAESLDALDDTLGIKRGADLPITKTARGDVSTLVGLGLMDVR